MTPQDQIPKCIPPSFYAACVADMDEQKLDDHIRDSYLAVAFLSASLRATIPGVPETITEAVGKMLAQHFASMTEDGASIWPTVEHFHNNPIDVVLWLLLNYGQPDDA